MIEVVRRKVSNKQAGDDGKFSGQTDRWKSETGWTVAVQPHSSNSGYIRVDAGHSSHSKNVHGWLAVDYLSSKASFQEIKIHPRSALAFFGQGPDFNRHTICEN